MENTPERELHIKTVKEEFIPHKIARYMKTSEIAECVNSYLREVFVDFSGVEIRTIQEKIIRNGMPQYIPTLGFDMILRQKVSDNELDDSHNIKLRESISKVNKDTNLSSVEEQSKENFRRIIKASNNNMITNRYQLTELGKDLIVKIFGAPMHHLETISNDFIGDNNASSSIVKIVDLPVSTIFSQIFRIDGWNDITWRFSPSGKTIPTIYSNTENIYLVEATSTNMVEDVARIKGINNEQRISSNPNCFYV